MGQYLLPYLILPLSVQLVAAICSDSRLLFANSDGKRDVSIIAQTAFCLRSCLRTAVLSMSARTSRNKYLWIIYISLVAVHHLLFFCLNNLSSVPGAEGKPKWLQWQLKYPTEWLVSSQSKQLMKKIQPEKLFIPSAQQIDEKKEFLFCSENYGIKNQREEKLFTFSMEQ